MSPCIGIGRLVHATEDAVPGFYGATVVCDNGGDVRLEAAAALRGGLVRFTFGASADRTIFVRLDSPLDAFVGGSVWEDPQRPGALFGFRSSNATHHCGAPRTLYWHATFEPAFLRLEERGATTYAAVFGDINITTVRSFISHLDQDGARRNAEAEIPLEEATIPSKIALDIGLHSGLATHRWDTILSAVAVAPTAVVLGGYDGDARTRFYSALYHAHLGPTLLADAADGGFKWGGRAYPVRS